MSEEGRVRGGGSKHGNRAEQVTNGLLAYNDVCFGILTCS